jgi:hypothetical protein
LDGAPRYEQKEEGTLLMACFGAKLTPFVYLLVTAVGLPGCARTSESVAAQSVEGAGSISLALHVTEDIDLTSIRYVISQSGTVVQSGSIDVSQATAPSAVIGGVPAGTGYLLSVAATEDELVACQGTSTSFDVLPGAVTEVPLGIACPTEDDGGAVLITGTLNACPVIENAFPERADVPVGSVVQLHAIGHDDDNGPSPLSYTWAASSGAFSQAVGADPLFSCTEVGTAVVTVTVSDGDLSPVCTSQGTWTLPVHCVSP